MQVFLVFGMQKKTIALAQEVQHAVGHEDLSVLDAFLVEMYGAQPDLWSDDLTGSARLRCITNYLTRMRLTDVVGRLEFEFKDALDAPMPTGFKPWFEFESQAAQTHQLILDIGRRCRVKPLAKNSKCRWMCLGQQLVAYRLKINSYLRLIILWS